ncbi:MAG TPA: two-component regulator propeller domain-containing protein, partial [Puia sp.]|nr:two-component regulator propeller domain-containing protein [Puia sp.]
MRTSLLLICLLHAAVAVYCQSPDIRFSSLTSKDGLLSNSVNAILKDRYGLMWFATDDGLNKFDGTNFTVYRHKPGDPFSLRANEILSLHEDRMGELWVATSGGAVSRYERDQDRFINYPAAGNTDGLTPTAVVRGICSDYLGKIWIAQFAAPYILDPSTGRTSRVSLTSTGGAVSGMSLFCVFEDSRRRMWIGTDSGLFLYKRATGSFTRFRHDGKDLASLLDDKVAALGEDRDGNLWIGTEKGLCRMLSDNSGFISYQQLYGKDTVLARNSITAITADKNGLLWIGTMDGLHVLDPQTGHSSTYLPEHGNIHSLTSGQIRSVYVDKEGIYWLGTFRGGVNKYDKNLNLFNLVAGDAFPGSPSGDVFINAFAERGDGKVYVGTDGGGLYLFDRITQKLRWINILPGQDKKTPVAVLALKMSRKGILYIGTFGKGLIILDPKTEKIRRLIMGKGSGDLNANEIFCLQEDKKGQIWAGTNGAGVDVLYNEKIVAKFTTRPASENEKFLPVNDYIRAIEEDRDGNIWIGSHGAGLTAYSPRTDKFATYNQLNSNLPSDKVHALTVDGSGRIWIGTYGGGLSVYDQKNNIFKNFSEKDGLQNTTIYQVVEDIRGRIWASTNTGITSLDVNSGTFRSFNHNNGLQNNNFIHGSGIRLSDGEMFFGGVDGFNYFNPAELTTNRNVPVVVLTDLKVSNSPVIPGDESPIKEQISVAKEVRLAFRQNFALSFVALNYTIPKQNQYAYKLEGFDKDWNYTGPANTAYYTNLDPGTYIFHVKASNNDGVWSSTDTVIRIYVKPPFWRTIYAWLFYLFAAGALLMYSRYRGITRIRKKFVLEQERQEARRLLELDRLKLKFLTNLSHEFRTPISLIMGPVDQLLATEKPDRSKDKLKMIKRNARRLLNLVNQLLDFRKMEEHELQLQLSEGELVAFVKDVSQSFTDMSERKHIKFSIQSDLEQFNAFFDKDKIERIIFNLLSNAFKFTLEGGAVTLVLRQLEVETGEGRKWVSLSISDTGIGMPQDQREKIFEHFFQHKTADVVLNQGTGIGLSITKEFVELHGGVITVESEPGKGSVFTVNLPLKEVESGAEKERGMPAEEEVLLPEDGGEGETPVEETNKAGNGIREMPSVLLVEDNEDFRFYLKDNLRSLYKVIEAADGHEGWQKALSNHPQVIVSDISMPRMDGITLVRKLKADKRTSHIPVILLTALTGEGQQLEGLGTGANDYITKPFSFEVLNVKIRNLLELGNTLKSTYTRQIKVLTPEVTIEPEDEKLLKKIVGYLEENLANPQLSVELLSKELGMSRSSLYSKLLEITGQKPVEFIRSYKLEKAAIFLQKSDLTIAEVAYMAGFSTPNYFARAFKAKYAMLPSEYAD